MSVLIVGAGIAGPSLAFWLRRYGHTVTVVERAPGVRPGGQAVDIRGVARTVASRMGLLDQIRTASLDERGLATVTASGRITSRMPADAFGGEGIVAEIEILRGDLATILYEATKSTVEYVFDDSVANIQQHATGVDVTLERGGVRTVDLVIGADGSHSRVRSLAFGPEQAFVKPLGVNMSYFTTPVRSPVDGWFLMHNAPGGRMAAIRPDHDGRAKAMLAYRSEAAAPPTVREQHEALFAAFNGVGWLVPDLLASMPAANDFYFDTLTQVHIERWSRGRIALVGDAAHSPSPLTGLGTSLALVGAYVLAGELARAGGDHDMAFTQYQMIMADYVRQCQELPPGGVNGFLPHSRLMIRGRALSMRMMLAWPMRHLLAGVFGKADSITLPDYESTVMAV